MVRNLFFYQFLLLALCAKAQDDLYFPPVNGSDWETVDPASIGWCIDELDTLQSFLHDRETKAFIILYKGRIAVEYYFDEFTEDSLWVWNSAGKTLTAFTVGMAQQEGLLDIDDPTSDYLGQGWSSCTPEQESAITIWHQLSMTSGLNDLVADNFCTEPQCLEYLEAPGERWAYHNAPYTLLTEVVAAAAGTTFNQFVNGQVSQPIGMTGFYFPFGYNRIYISTIRDMARFGLLMQAGGSWNGDGIMTDQAFFEALTIPSQSINESYGYLWWLNGQDSFMMPGVQFQFPGSLIPTAPDDLVAAIGKDSQLINLVPSQDICVLRMGQTADDDLVATNFNNDLWALLDLLLCDETGMTEQTATKATAYPQPASTSFTLEGVPPDVRWTAFTLSGRQQTSGTGVTIACADWPSGVYIIDAGSERIRVQVTR